MIGIGLQKIWIKLLAFKPPIINSIEIRHHKPRIMTESLLSQKKLDCQ